VNDRAVAYDDPRRAAADQICGQEREVSLRVGSNPGSATSFTCYSARPSGPEAVGSEMGKNGREKLQ
jgi:hypothetical protein